MQFDRLKRREFIALLGGAVAAWPMTARAQQAAKIPRIGIIDDAPMWQTFRQTLRELGYIEGQTVNYEYRYSEGAPDRLATVVGELIRRPVDLIATFGTPPTQGVTDDAMPEEDETLLELLAERIRAARPPTSAELLTAAQLRSEATFKGWSPHAVGRRLKTYGLKLGPKVNGVHRFAVTLEALRVIAERYGLDLGTFPGARSSERSP